MGNFSRDPKARLADSVAKHYVGVRLQQGVPIVDADWNELEDLRRYEFENFGNLFIGNGVPVGNDGFRIASIAGGGVNTIVLVSKATGVGPSSVKIDLVNSTAAAALGFDQKNFTSARFGSSPAQLTGNRTQPFNLTPGSTLVVQTDDQPPETVTFTAGSFTNIAAATAAEVVAAITAAITGVTAKVGAGNDFIIKGGDGTSANAGRILVEGQMVLNEADLKYSEQPLYKNIALADAWNVEPAPELATPTAAESYVVYLDVWHREVDSNEDLALVDDRIGVETANRLRREWAVRVAKLVDFPSVLAAKPVGHAFYQLAQLNRVAGNAGITEPIIIDERDTDLAVRREIAYRGIDGTILVNSQAFLNMLIPARDNVRDFIQFLTTRFVQPSDGYVAGEVIGLETLSAVANVADHGIALLNTKSLGTKDAFIFFEQLLNAEKRFVDIWKTAVLPVNKDAGRIYEAAFTEMITRIETFLIGPLAGGFFTITDALARKNLFEAVRSQEQVNTEFGQEITRPTGSLILIYLGSLTPTILRNQSFDLRYRVSGSVTPQDDIDVEVFIDSAWQTTLKNAEGPALPFRLQLGPGSGNKEFIVTVKAPDLAAAETTISLQVSARHNRGGLRHISTQKTLRIGNPPPPSEENFVITISSTNVSHVNGIFQVPTSLSHATMNFRLSNNTNTALVADLEYQPVTSPPWTIQKGSFDLEDQVIPARGHEDFSFRFRPPLTPGNTLIFSFRAKESTTTNVVAEIQITLRTV